MSYTGLTYVPQLRIFRWFNFTLKLPNIIPIGKLWLAIQDTSFWIFFSNLETMDLEIYLRLILVIFYICHFLTIWGHLNIFQKIGALKKSWFSWWRDDHYSLISLNLGDRFLGQTLRGYYGPSKVEYYFFDWWAIKSWLLRYQKSSWISVEMGILNFEAIIWGGV